MFKLHGWVLPELHKLPHFKLLFAGLEPVLHCLPCPALFRISILKLHLRLKLPKRAIRQRAKRLQALHNLQRELPALFRGGLR